MLEALCILNPTSLFDEASAVVLAEFYADVTLEIVYAVYPIGFVFNFVGRPYRECGGFTKFVCPSSDFG